MHDVLTPHDAGLASTRDRFPLGRPFTPDATDDGVGVHRPFGATLATPARPVAGIDVSRVGYDPRQQIAFVTDADGTKVPLARHSTGATRTNTASRDSGPQDSDTDHTED